MTRKRILIVFISLICIIGEVKADYNYEPIPFETGNTFSDFQRNRGLYPFIEGYDIEFDSSEERMNDIYGEDEDEDEDDDLSGKPSGLGVGELPLSDGLSILLSLACLYILWNPLVRFFRRFYPGGIQTY